MKQWLTRQTILERAKNPNDHQAWEDFVQYYIGYIHIVLRKVLYDDTNIDDITQEILLKIWKYLSKFECNSEKAQFRRWLSVLIRNQAINYIKSDSGYNNRKDLAIRELTDSEVKPSELEVLCEAEWKKYVVNCALKNIEDKFSGNAIVAFKLHLLEKSVQEISQELGIKNTSVYTLVNRVRLRLANEVERLQKTWEL
ncbi:MAG: RNA polymerase sigma factor [Lentisphaeraceae bacterium]|nr:RNA polymerase sigma factor [Lentisphaeraceae bacterium]